MGKAIRDAGECANFTAIITYPNTITQIPSHCSFIYTTTENKDSTTLADNQQVEIIKLDKVAEYIVLKNTSNTDIDITGWKIISVTGEQSFVFPSFILKPNTTVNVGDSDIAFHWLTGTGVWNNSKSDPAELYNSKENL